jgi:hypothetical protein
MLRLFFFSLSLITFSFVISAQEVEEMSLPAPRIRVVGQVKSVDTARNHVTVKLRDGNVRLLKVDPGTTIFSISYALDEDSSKRIAVSKLLELKELAAGDSVVVVFQHRDGRSVARLIERLGN